MMPTKNTSYLHINSTQTKQIIANYVSNLHFYCKQTSSDCDLFNSFLRFERVKSESTDFQNPSTIYPTVLTG